MTAPAPGTLGECPGPEALEALVSGAALDDRVRRHVDACAACRAQALEIRENLEFMKSFAHGVEWTDAPASQTPPADVLPGYRLVRMIARGGQGVVYEAVQTETKRHVAVKMIDPGPGRARARRRIEREAELVAQLRHPNIVTVYDSAPLPDGRYALAMEFIRGQPLDSWAREVDAGAGVDRSRVREAVRAKIRAIAAVCDAVQHAHQNGIIHRDLKPGNVLVDAQGVPRVVDFGVARRLITDDGVTRAGEFAGTLAYASPEQVSGDPDAVDTRSDVYSLGVILYEVLAARRPYQTERSLTGAIVNITRTDPDPLGPVQPGDQPADDELETIVRRALAKERAERYQTAGALGADLENYLAGRAVEAKRDSALYILRKTAARHRAAVGAVGVFVLVLGAFALVKTLDAEKLARQRSLLASSLSASTIERARLLADNDADARAESLIWPELLASGADPADPNLGFGSSVSATQAAWALFDLYSRHPSLMRTPTLSGACALRFDRPDAVRVLNGAGAFEVLSVPDGRVLERGPACFGEECGRTYFDLTRTRAIRCCDGRAEILDPAGATRRPLTGGSGSQSVHFADLSPDGRRAAIVDTEGVLSLWSTEPPARIADLASGLIAESRARFAFDGVLLTAGVGDTIRAWRSEDGAPVDAWRIPPDLWAQSVRPLVNVAQLSPDNRLLAAGYSTSLLLFDRSFPGSPPVVLPGHRGFVNHLGFSADGRVLVTCGYERGHRAWCPKTGRLLATFEQEVMWRALPAVSDDGSLLASVDANDRLRIWQTTPNAWLERLGGPANTVHCVRFSPDGTRLACASADGSLYVWRMPSRVLEWRSEPAGSPLTSIAFSPDGGSIVGASNDGRVRTWSAEGGAPQAEFAGPLAPTWITVTPDGADVLIACGFDPDVHILDRGTGRERARLSGHRARVVEGAIAPDGRSLASVSGDGLCILWDLSRRTELARFGGHSAPARAVAFSPDGAQLATGSDDWTIRLRSVRTGECTSVLRDVRQHVFGLAYHPTGNLLFSCCRDAEMQVWDTRTGREIATLRGHAKPVLSLALAPDGRTLASGSEDCTVGVWDLAYYQRHVRCNAGAWRSPAPDKR